MVQLPQETLDAIATIVDSGRVESDYTGRDEDGGSFMEESVPSTLSSLSRVFRDMKTIHDPADVLDP